MYTTEVNALITLIEDPDEAIYLQVRSALKSYGEQIIPHLEYYWELNDFGPLFQTRLEELINTIQYESVYDRLKRWKQSEDKDLLEGALIINRYGYPGCDEEELRRKIMRVRQDIWLELNDHLTAIEVYLAKSLDVPIYGVNLPSHFILCYLDYDSECKEWGITEEDAEVLFYINPFSEGAMLRKEEIDEFLANQNLPQDNRFYRPCSNQEMISRMLNNLIHSYISRNNEEKVRELRALQSILLEQED